MTARIEELRAWHRRATMAMATSNDAEHDALVEIVDAVEVALQDAEVGTARSTDEQRVHDDR
jgi:hypothetical protein